MAGRHSKRSTNAVPLLAQRQALAGVPRPRGDSEFRERVSLRATLGPGPRVFSPCSRSRPSRRASSTCASRIR
jgi:hypothetical protein